MIRKKNIIEIRILQVLDKTGIIPKKNQKV
jgi:hypothetical protein